MNTPTYAPGESAWPDGCPGTLVTVDLENHEPFEFCVTGLEAGSDYEIPTFRFQRAPGGDGTNDRTIRSNIFAMVGAITVYGGLIEAEMKRIILKAEGLRNESFVDVELTWTDLEKRLQAVADGGGDYSELVASALAFGRTKRIKAIRDNAVHSAWCLFDVGHMQASRFRRKSDGESRVESNETMSRAVQLMIQYLNMLTGIVSWPTAILPALSNPPRIPNVTLDVEGSVARAAETPNC